MLARADVQHRGGPTLHLIPATDRESTIPALPSQAPSADGRVQGEPARSCILGCGAEQMECKPGSFGFLAPFPTQVFGESQSEFPSLLPGHSRPKAGL